MLEAHGWLAPLDAGAVTLNEIALLESVV